MPQYIEVKKILTRVAKSDESFRDAKAVVESSKLDLGVGRPDMQGESVPIPSQSNIAQSYAAVKSRTNTTTQNQLRHALVIQTQTDGPVVPAVVNRTDLGEGTNNL